MTRLSPPGGEPDGARPADGSRPPVSYFVVSFIPPETASRLLQAVQGLPASCTLQDPERMHITFHALVELPPRHLAPLKETLAEVASSQPPFSVNLLGGGLFEGGAIWARVCSPEIMALQARLARALEEIGLPEPAHPFVPHVTVASCPLGTQLPETLLKLDLWVSIDELTLTTTGTTEYRVARRFPLAGPSPKT